MDLEQIEAERLDLGQHAVQCGPVQQTGEHGVRAMMLRRQRRERASTVAPRCPLIRIMYEGRCCVGRSQGAGRLIQ